MTDTTFDPDTIDLSLGNVRRLLHDALEEKGPEYRYRSTHYECTYLEYANPEHKFTSEDTPTGPSCIVGHVLVGAGIPMGHIQQALEGIRMSATAIKYLGIEDQIEGPVLLGLREAQRVQDHGGTWGTAVAQFEVEVSGA